MTMPTMVIPGTNLNDQGSTDLSKSGNGPEL